jgi:hypothetical protein
MMSAVDVQCGLGRMLVGEPTAKNLDTGTPHSARLWNYWLGGKDNFQADREAGDAIAGMLPSIVALAREDRRFLRRSVEHLVREGGIRQILDIGTGLPTADNTHQVAQSVAPETRVVYVDNDPLVLVHARALLSGAPEGVTNYVEADLNDPESILRAAGETLDFSQPIGLALAVVRRLVDELAPGSYLAIAHGCHDINTAEAHRIVDFWNERGTPKIKYRSSAEIAAFFDGLRLLEPGVVPCNRWRPDGDPGEDVNQYCGVAIKE